MYHEKVNEERIEWFDAREACLLRVSQKLLHIAKAEGFQVLEMCALLKFIESQAIMCEQNGLKHSNYCSLVRVTR